MLTISLLYVHCATATSMQKNDVALSNEPNTWSKLELQHEESEDAESCVDDEDESHSIAPSDDYLYRSNGAFRLETCVGGGADSHGIAPNEYLYRSKHEAFHLETCIGDEGEGRNISRSNYLHISKYEAPVEGEFILDLSSPPPPPPPGIALGTDRKNLTLHTTSGRVTAEIWIKNNGSTESRRVSMDLFSGYGPVRAIVHDPPLNRSSRARPFLNMELRSENGDVYISLPRCFRGPITIHTRDDRIAFSRAFKECTTLISDISGVRVYFVGDRPHVGKWGTGNDNGKTAEDFLDEISVYGRYTSVRINWDGDDEVPFMMLNSWMAFVGGAERFFTTGRIL